MVEVPDLKELSEEDAKLSLEQRGLGLGEVINQPSDNVIAGAVIKQSITNGTKVSPGSVVDIYVSTGPETGSVIVPDVRDVDKDKAVEMLEQEKLEAKIIEDYSETYAEGKVTSQGVQPGSSVPRGYIITLTVSKGKDPNAVTEATTQPTTQAATVVQTIPKKAVSIPVMPQFDELSLGEEEDPSISVKVIAKNSAGSRTVIENSYLKSEFPFTVNDQIDKDTTYEIYFNGTLIESVSESY
jgi:beta-lactam-binding protein with PASTA domain